MGTFLAARKLASQPMVAAHWWGLEHAYHVEWVDHAA
jgi:hypothetical protein